MAAAEIGLAISIAPGEASYHSNLSAILRAQSKWPEAAASAERAVALAPKMAAAHNNLALALFELEQGDKAESAFTRAIELDPKFPEALANFGLLRAHQRRYYDARNFLSRAIQLRPSYAQAFLWLGDVLAAEQSPMAVEAYRRALALDQGNAEAIRKYGVALASMGGAETARTFLEQAVALSPRSLAAITSLASFLRERGDLSAAAETIRAALVQFPDDPGLLRALAGLTRIDNRSHPLLEALLRAYAGAVPQSDARQQLAFALGKAFDDLGDYDRAFDFLAEGNRLRRATLDYNERDEAGALAALRRIFTPAHLAHNGGTGDPSRAPIFIVGMPRSGTTLTEQILAAHPDVYGAGELNFVEHAAVEAFGFDPLREPMRLASDGVLDFARMGKTYLGWLPPEAKAKPRVTDKMPHNFRLVGLIRLALPNAKIIHVRRAPLDNCLSIFKASFSGEGLRFAYDLSELGRYYNLYREHMRHWNLVMPGELHEVQYEDLVAEPEATSRALLEFCGLSWDPAVLDFHRSKREVRTASYAQVRRPIYTDSINSAARYGAHLDPLRAALDEWSDG